MDVGRNESYVSEVGGRRGWQEGRFGGRGGRGQGVAGGVLDVNLGDFPFVQRAQTIGVLVRRWNFDGVVNRLSLDPCG